jgi:peptidoglycan glycosyltransferase
MNAPIRRLAAVVLAMFGALLLSTTYIQFVQAGSLRDKPNNRRTLLQSYSRQRGPIIIGGKPVARSVPTDDDLKYVRKYTDAELYAHLTGYYSFVYGAGAGIERSENSLLSGQSDQLFYRRVVDLVTGREPQGASVELTIDPKAQQAAVQGLGKQRGAVVALDPRTGAILAMASNPTYDPNTLSSHDLGSVQKAYQQLNTDDADPLINRGINALYPPGSTFKLITAAAALSTGKYTEDSQVPGPAALPLPQTSISLHNDDNAPCGPGGKVDLTHALQISCNTAFASLGLTLGGQALRDQASKFGFGQSLHVPMPVSASVVPDSMNKPQTAQAAIGQFDVRVTPLQMAMVSAAIANKGVVMSPYVVKTVRSPDLDVLEQASPEQLGSPAVTPDVAEQLTRMMEKVVEAGTGTRAQIPGVAVAGKTGTAQHGKGAAPHAWFTSFAPADDPKVAVAVVVEDGGELGNEAFGGKVAAPIAKAVMQAVIG